MTGQEIMQALIDRGYAPHHAAALAGHALQESGGHPDAINEKEGAHGLYQWRLDRWRGLQNYAVSRNSFPEDPNVQLDYVAHEMSGPEAKSGAAFLASKDLPSASAALKSYIRFGDNSDATRLRYGQSLLGGAQSSPAGNGGRAAAVVPAIPSSPVSGGQSSDAQSPGNDQALTAALQKIPESLKAQPTEAPQLAPIEIPQPAMTPAMIRARQLAAAMIAKSLNPGTST